MKQKNDKKVKNLQSGVDTNVLYLHYDSRYSMKWFECLYMDRYDVVARSAKNCFSW